MYIYSKNTFFFSSCDFIIFSLFSEKSKKETRPGERTQKKASKEGTCLSRLVLREVNETGLAEGVWVEDGDESRHGGGDAANGSHNDDLPQQNSLPQWNGSGG